MFFDSKECSWSDMGVLIAGSPLIKIRRIRYKSSKEKKLLHVAGDQPISIQSGNREYDGEIVVLKGALDDMNRAAKLAGGEDILDIEFDAIIDYQEALGRARQSDTLVQVQVKEFEKGWDQGADHMEVTLPIVFLRKVSVE